METKNLIESLLVNLPIIHASYNFLMLLLFCYQGFLGVKIKNQRAKGNSPINTIKIHRKTGPYLAIFGISGFLSGLAMVFIYTRTFINYTLHYVLGTALAVLIFVTYLISKKITADSFRLRQAHFTIGIAIILLYMTQTITGIKKLLAYF